MLRFAQVSSRFIAFFIRRVSFFRYSLSRSKYIYNLSVSIRCLLDAYNTLTLSLSYSPPYNPPSFSLSPSLPLLLPPRPRSQKEKRRGCYPSTLCRSLQLVPDGFNDPGVDALTCGGCCRFYLIFCKSVAAVLMDPKNDPFQLL